MQFKMPKFMCGSKSLFSDAMNVLVNRNSRFAEDRYNSTIHTLEFNLFIIGSPGLNNGLQFCRRKDTNFVKPKFGKYLFCCGFSFREKHIAYYPSFCSFSYLRRK